jgi:hypothetical protein
VVTLRFHVGWVLVTNSKFVLPLFKGLRLIFFEKIN